MKAGDIIFVRGHNPLSKIVRWFDKGKFSHCAVAVSETHIFEADWYTKAKISEFNYTDYEIVELDLTHEEREIIVHNAIEMVGKWYDYPQILWYILSKLLRLKGKNKFNNPNMLICSEAIFYLLAETGRIECAIGLDFDVTPNQMYAHIKNIQSCRR